MPRCLVSGQGFYTLKFQLQTGLLVREYAARSARWEACRRKPMPHIPILLEVLLVHGWVLALAVHGRAALPGNRQATSCIGTLYRWPWTAKSTRSEQPGSLAIPAWERLNHKISQMNRDRARGRRIALFVAPRSFAANASRSGAPAPGLLRVVAHLRRIWGRYVGVCRCSRPNSSLPQLSKFVSERVLTTFLLRSCRGETARARSRNSAWSCCRWAPYSTEPAVWPSCCRSIVVIHSNDVQLQQIVLLTL